MQEMIFQAPQGYPMPERLCYNAADLRLLTSCIPAGRANYLPRCSTATKKPFCINANRKSQKQSKKSA